MAGSRKPGPLGSGGQPDVIDDGTLCRQLSPKPGPLCASQAPQPSTGLRLAHSFGVQPPSLPYLRQGDSGDNVKKLQSFLNFRLDLRPPLAVDGYFWPPTRKAVVEFQTSRSIKADGEVGKATWYHLITGTPAKQAQPGMAGGATLTPMSSYPPWRPPTDSVMDWSLQKKLEYVVDKVPSNLPAQFQMQFAGLVSPQSLAIMLAAIADSELFGVAGHARIAMLSEQVFRELAHPTQITALATTKPELDEAALDLADAFATAGVAALLGALAKSELVEGGGTTEKEPSAPKEPPPKRPAPRKTPPPPLPPLSFDAPKTWIEIQLVDENGNPVPGEKYSVKTSDGTVFQGTLDGNGLARVANIDPGNCVVSFPDIDSREWNPA